MAAPTPPDLFDQFARGWRGYLIIAVIALFSSQFGAARMPVIDRDEARFAQASRQKVETGDFVRIRLQDDERNKKPIGVYWLQAASVQALAPITGRLNQIWPYRPPSALGAILAALAAYWAGSALLFGMAFILHKRRVHTPAEINILQWKPIMCSIAIGSFLDALKSMLNEQFSSERFLRLLWPLFYIALRARHLCSGPELPVQ